MAKSLQQILQGLNERHLTGDAAAVQAYAQLRDQELAELRLAHDADLVTAGGLLEQLRAENDALRATHPFVAQIAAAQSAAKAQGEAVLYGDTSAPSEAIGLHALSTLEHDAVYAKIGSGPDGQGPADPAPAPTSDSTPTTPPSAPAETK